MPKRKKRIAGEIFRPVAQVLTEKEGLPTRLQIGENQYFMINPAQDRQNYVNNSKARRKQRRAQERGGAERG